MKQTTLAIAILTLIGCQSLSAQKIITKTKPKTAKTVETWEETHTFGERVSYVSLKRDTLILPNDKLGKLIYSSWNDTPKHKQPVIIFADAVTIKNKNEVLYAFLKKKQTLTNN